VGVGRSKVHLLEGVASAALVVLAGCNACDRSQRAPTGVAASASAEARDVCAAGGRVTDPSSAGILPPKAAGFCVDPNGVTRAFEEPHIAGACEEFWGADCDRRETRALERLVVQRYVEGKTVAEVRVLLGRFRSDEAAFTFYTRRLLGGRDPRDPALTHLEAGSSGALASGSAYVWKGRHFVELVYTNRDLAPRVAAERSRAVLVALGQALGSVLPGEGTTLPAVALLPEADRLPFGVTYALDDALGVEGIGPGAVGQYQRADVAWRVLVLVPQDEDSAKDALRVFARLPGADDIDDLGFDAYRVGLTASDAGTRTEWVVGRRGGRIVAVGDAELPAGVTVSKAELASTRLSERDKQSRVREVLAR
jgi:hypothetical protein